MGRLPWNDLRAVDALDELPQPFAREELPPALLQELIIIRDFPFGLGLEPLQAKSLPILTSPPPPPCLARGDFSPFLFSVRCWEPRIGSRRVVFSGQRSLVRVIGPGAFFVSDRMGSARCAVDLSIDRPHIAYVIIAVSVWFV